MLNKKTFLNLNSIAIPLVLSSISGIIMGIIDQALVGRISIYAYGGVGLVTSTINSIIGILGSMSIAFNILGSQCKGEDNIEELNNKLTIYLIINLFIGISLFFIINIWCKEILKLGFGLHGQTLKEATDFIRVFSVSILLNLLIFMYSTVFKIFRKTKHIFTATIIVNIINIILDYILIFGKFGVPAMGSQGAAIGTVIALFINLMIYVFASRKLIKINFKIKYILSRIKDVFNFSIPFIGQEFMEDIVFVIGLNAIIARIGIVELSTYTLILQIINVILMPMFGYTTANLSLVSESYAKRETKNLLNISKCTSIILIIIYLIVFISIILFKGYIPQFITSDKTLINSAEKFLPLAIFIQLFNYIMSVYKSSMQAINYQRWTLKVTFIVNICTLVLILLIGNSLSEIYISIGLSYIFNCILFYFKYTKILNGLNIINET